MKRKKLVKSASVVALSAVLMCGTALSLTACGKNEYELSVFIFCSDTDAATNEQICDTWAKQYTEKLRAENVIDEDTEVTVNFTYQSASDTYTTYLNNHFTSGQAEDIFYMSPRYAKTWSVSKSDKRVLDLTKYMSETDAQNLTGIWSDAVAFYGYSTSDKYTQGEKLEYLTAEQAEAKGYTAGAGFYTVSGNVTDQTVGIYGLPKDYSNFAMAYNANYFSDQMKYWLTHNGPSTDRNVVAGYGAKKGTLTYTGGSGESGVITYACDGNVIVYNEDGTTTTQAVKKGDPANFINVGIPVNIKPYNFYRFSSYNEAFSNGDPIALATDAWAPEGYVVTMPGFPGDTFAIDSQTATDADAPYDTSTGYTVFTYAEFGALVWATTFFCNTFNYWDALKNNASLTNGTGGMVAENGTRYNVYGVGQYEGAPNPTLYTLPWLYGNDADFISEDSQNAVNPGVTTNTSDLDTVAKMQAAVAGQQAETRQKLSLDGTYRDVNVYYGMNSYNFLEMYGAMLEFGSTWNGNGENCGDEDDKADNSWASFRQGYNIMYGSGTWDAQARNESDLQNYCTFATMPSAVSEKYALYSHVKDAFYNQQSYAYVETKVEEGKSVVYYWNGSAVVGDNNNERITSNPNQDWTQDAAAADGSKYIKSYTAAEIAANQTIRQDKWGARMDSVGYAVNSSLEELAGTDKEWKLEAAVSLALALSVDETAQVTLSYGGAQLPNFVSQCEEFLYYNLPEAKYWTESGKTTANGAFNKMLTPEGFYDTGYWKWDETAKTWVKDAEGVAKAKKIWDEYYKIINEMNALANGVSTQTVKEFLTGKTITVDGETLPVSYDPQYENVQFKDFTKENYSYRAFAMKVLYMQTYTKADRDLQMRMQYGLNSARDSAMYTYNTTWILNLSTRTGSSLAYMNQVPITGGVINEKVLTVASGKLTNYQTAAVHCLQIASQVYQDLEDAKEAERRDGQ